MKENHTIYCNRKEAERTWFAFIVRPRHEKKTSERLQFEGFAIFCPLIKTKVKWHDRWRKVQKPWINGYIFAFVTESERRELLQDPSVVSTVCTRYNGKSTPAIIREEEIKAMKIMTKDATAVQVFEGPEVKKKLLGKNVEIQHGPFKDFAGIVEKISKNTLSIKLNGLNMHLMVTVEPQDVGVIND